MYEPGDTAEDLVELTIDDALRLAIDHYQAGRLELAEHVCRQVVAAEPDHADTRHLLGVIALQRGDLGAASEDSARSVLRAIQRSPRRVRAYLKPEPVRYAA